MAIDHEKMEELFDAARTRTADDRARYLAEACGPDTELRAAVESLLTAHAAAAGFLQTPAVDVDLDPPLELSRPGTVIGRYKLLEPIGEGGYGTVFMAEQTTPVQRKVALKIIKAGMDTKQVIARFEAERQALALMDHPNIAKVFDAGVTDTGRPYFVMELVKGMPITKYCDEHRIEPRQRLELFMQVCQAVQHAHQKGIIHRDIKPSNVLIALYDGKPVPKVIDFGVAKATGQQLTERTMFTGFGDVIGTLEYMSPEQAEVNQLDVDTRSDIYSLGVLLYELLTGTTPLERDRVMKAGLLEMLRVVREEEPPRPSMRLSAMEQLPSVAANRGLEPKKLSGLVHGELDWIVMKALEKDRVRRYETANGLAMDVQRYLSDETVQACPPSAVYQLRKFVRRNRGPVMAGLLIAISLVAGMISFATQSAQLRSQQALTLGQKAIAERERLRADDRAEEAERQKHLMEQEKTRAEKSLYDASIIAASRAISAQRHDQARQLLNDCPVERRNWEWGRLLYLCNLDLMTIQAHAGAARAAEFSPDGSMIASGGEDKLVKIFDAGTGKELRQLVGHHERVNAVAFSPSEALLATASGGDEKSADNSVRLWNPTTGELLATLAGHSDRVCGLAFSPDGRRLASGGADHQVILWDVAGRREERRLLGHKGPVFGIAFHPNGELVVSTGWIPESDLKVWNVRDGALVKSIRGGEWGLSCAAFSHDGSVLAAAGKGGHIFRVKTSDFSPMKGLTAAYYISSLAFHPTRDEIAVSCIYAAFIVSGAQTQGESQRTFEGPQGKAWSVRYDGDGKRVLIAFDDGTLRIFDAGRMDAASITMRSEVQGVWPYVRSLAVSADGATVATAIAQNAYARVWDSRTGSERLNLGPHPEEVSWVAMTPDGTHLVTTSDGPRLWDLKTLTCSSFIGATTDDRYCAALDGQGKVLITGAVAGEVKLWSMETRKLIRVLSGKRGPVARVALSASGTVAATAERETVVLWDATTGEPLRELDGELKDVRGLAFSPDGSLLATGSGLTPRIWDVASGRLVGKCIGHSENAWTVAFSPDGRRLATGSVDGSVRVWDVHSQRELLSAEAQSSRNIYAVAFSGDASVLVSAGRGYGYAETVVRPTLPWSAAAYPAESSARDAAVEVQKREYWRSLGAARNAAARPTTVPVDASSGSVIDLAALNAKNGRAWKLRTEGKLDEAEALRRSVVEDAARVLPPADPKLQAYRLAYGRLLVEMKRYADAETSYQAVSDAIADLPDHHPRKVELHNYFRRLYEAWAKPLEEKVYLQRLSATQPHFATTVPTTTAPRTVIQSH